MNSLRLILSAVFALSVSAHAQWLNYPTAGMPRTPNGTPDLAAPAPRTAEGKPDLSGIWINVYNPDTPPPPLQPWAALKHAPTVLVGAALGVLAVMALPDMRRYVAMRKM